MKKELLCLFLGVAVGQDGCVPTCTSGTPCLQCGTEFVCGSSCVKPTNCDVATCNGAQRPVAPTCYDGSLSVLECDPLKCGWTTSCPPNPCDPNPCATTERCNICTPDRPCLNGAFFCTPTDACQCPPPIPTAFEKCWDGTESGSFCPRVASTDPNCQWKTRTCPPNPCSGIVCPTGQVCKPSMEALISGANAPYLCAEDLCAGVTCRSSEICRAGKCYCNPNVATEPPVPVVWCASTRLESPFFNPTTCTWEKRDCDPLPPPPSCTGDAILINALTRPECVPPTNPCATIKCALGFTCIAKPGVPPFCACQCPPLATFEVKICADGSPTMVCNQLKCQWEPKACLPDPCGSVNCDTTDRCVNMDANIVASPLCLPRNPCEPNPCTDPNTVCFPKMITSSGADATTGVTTFVEDVKPFVCEPRPVQETCVSCLNGGACVKTETGIKCRCQPGWKGEKCQVLACDDCAATSQQCASANAILASEGAQLIQRCVCNNDRYSGITCQEAKATPDGQPSPPIVITSRDAIKNEIRVQAPLGTEMTVKPGILEEKIAAQFNLDTVVIEVNRKDGAGVNVPGPLPKGEFATIDVTSPTFVSDRVPTLSLIEPDKIRDSAEICAEINPGVEVRKPTFKPPTTWTFPICHCSLYAVGDQTATSAAGEIVGFSLASVSAFVLFGTLF